jgi:hypothetical protein
VATIGAGVSQNPPSESRPIHPVDLGARA